MGRATFRREISPLRFAAVEMTVVVSSRAEERVGMGQRLWALMKRRVERSPATMGRATFRREISLLRFAFVEMTEGADRLFLKSAAKPPPPPFEPGPRSGPFKLSTFCAEPCEILFYFTGNPPEITGTVGKINHTDSHHSYSQPVN